MISLNDLWKHAAKHGSSESDLVSMFGVSTGLARWAVKRANHVEIVPGFDERIKAYRATAKRRPEMIKYLAHMLTAIAHREGRLVNPGACEICQSSEGNIVAHHHDYARPLDVTWLCKPCHGKVHAGTLTADLAGERRRYIHDGECLILRQDPVPAWCGAITNHPALTDAGRKAVES